MEGDLHEASVALSWTYPRGAGFGLEASTVDAELSESDDSDTDGIAGLHTLLSVSKIISHPTTSVCPEDWRIRWRASNPILRNSTEVVPLVVTVVS